MSECHKVLGNDFFSDLRNHKCHLCEKCLICHHCLLARGYLRRPKINVPKGKMNNILDLIYQEVIDDDDDPPRYIFVGPNNEIVEQFSKDSVDDNPEIVEPVSSSNDKDVEPEEPVYYTCDECGKVFSNEQDFSLHKIYHSVDEVFECKICNKTFDYSYELIKHSLYHNAKSFICGFCNKSYATEEKLELHMRYHTGAKPFVCNICQKGFKENGTLKSHLLTHTEERPFQCDKCGRSFRFKLKLERHNWIHEGIKPYVCLVCEKAFRHKCNLRTHVKRYHNVSLEHTMQSQEDDM